MEVSLRDCARTITPDQSFPTQCHRHGTSACAQSTREVRQERHRSLHALLWQVLCPRCCSNLNPAIHTHMRDLWLHLNHRNASTPAWSHRCLAVPMFNSEATLMYSSPGVHPDGLPEDGGLIFHINSRYSRSFSGLTSNTVFPRAL